MSLTSIHKKSRPGVTKSIGFRSFRCCVAAASEEHSVTPRALCLWKREMGLAMHETPDKQQLAMKGRMTDSPRRGMVTLASLVAAILLLPPLVGCRSTATSPPPQHVLTATVAGYQIQVSSDRPATLESRDDHALITFAHHRLRVEKGRVVLDDNVTAAFPVTATQIAIELERGSIRVTADGQEMWKQSRVDNLVPRP